MLSLYLDLSIERETTGNMSYALAMGNRCSGTRVLAPAVTGGVP